MCLSSSIFSIHIQGSLVMLIKPYVKTKQNGCDLDLCFKSMMCVLPSWCYHTNVLRILSYLFYLSTTTSMSTQSLSVELVGLNRRFGRVTQRTVGWAKNLHVHMGTSALLVWSYLSDMFCRVKCWSLWVRSLSPNIIINTFYKRVLIPFFCFLSIQLNQQHRLFFFFLTV